MNNVEDEYLLFPVGQITADQVTVRALGERIETYVHRHQIGDWGHLTTDARLRNIVAQLTGGEIVSAFHAEGGITVTVRTTADRRATVVDLHVHGDFDGG